MNEMPKIDTAAARPADMDAVLPVTLGSRVQWSSADVALRATDAGQRHPILRQGIATQAREADCEYGKCLQHNFSFL